jgi:hypothetical protein
MLIITEWRWSESRRRPHRVLILAAVPVPIGFSTAAWSLPNCTLCDELFSA